MNQNNIRKCLKNLNKIQKFLLKVLEIVEAGRKLAEYNKKAKKALSHVTKKESEDSKQNYMMNENFGVVDL